ncbi:hypothetical protein BDP27DRAFT_1415281 [Rhodocollybia butyracea]|uniref:Uncharacterized protein n=1 Tax=Rhodocollybia butyracea TaxID=206335 RepID=A0A9P5UEP4_9AGAR|nr:hypothetical protein BDP27DRAFT_1415281 [Rhodocollybia butyracea]
MGITVMSQYIQHPFAQNAGYRPNVAHAVPISHSSRRYHPYNGESIFTSNHANTVSDNIQYHPALAARYAQRLIAMRNAHNLVTSFPQSSLAHPVQTSIPVSTLHTLDQAQRIAQNLSERTLPIAAPMPKVYATRNLEALNMLFSENNNTSSRFQGYSHPSETRSVVSKQHRLQNTQEQTPRTLIPHQLDSKENFDHSFFDSKPLYYMTSSSQHQSTPISNTDHHPESRNFDDSSGSRKSVNSGFGSSGSATNSGSHSKEPGYQSTMNMNLGSSPPCRPVSPDTMLALTEPILMDWCFDDEAIQRLAKAAGYGDQGLETL